MERSRAGARVLTVIWIVISIAGAAAAEYYVAPTGNDAQAGTIDQPFRTVGKAVSLAVAGDTIYLRGGIYPNTTRITLSTSGEEGRPIRLWAYPGENPVLDFTGELNEGLRIRGAYWHLKGITVAKAENGGIKLQQATAHDNRLEAVTAHANGDTGIDISNGAHHTTFLNCDAYENFDAEEHGQDADGFGAKFAVGEGVEFIGCRSWNNSDDGFDCWYAGNGVYFERCYAWRNGVNIWNDPLFEGNANGFKLGQMGGAHLLIRCVAWGHPSRGFDLNGNSTGVTLFHCTAWANQYRNFAFTSSNGNIDKNVLRNNLSFQGVEKVDPLVDDQYNSWNNPPGVTITANDFVSFDESSITGPRRSDGSLPVTDFLRLKTGSGAIDAGLNVGLLYAGPGPDLGAYEWIPGDVVWADFGWRGDQFGTQTEPFSTLEEALFIVIPTGIVRIKGDSGVNATSEKPRIAKAARLEASGGPIRIGVVSAALFAPVE